ncbi:MAG: lipopolysaccharide transport periplasmic protein LptA [Campylobacterales bacterium]|nr:lipopolysaccharide transport periplasmic protein LptA [Campylobacterales bacterium]
MRLLLFFCLSFFMLYAQSVEITANNFEADDKKKESKFSGNVEINRTNSYIKTSTLKIFFNDKKKPIKYEAIGDCKFEIETNDKKKYKGVSDKLIYLPFEKRYEFLGNSYLEEVQDGKKLFATEIILDEISGNAIVKGDDKKPLKFIFNLEEK